MAKEDILQSLNENGFEVFNLLGRGSFASVYKAVHKKTAEEVAIKVIDIEQMKSRNLEDRIDQEIRIHACLKHPSIVQLYDHFQAKNHKCMVLELCHEGTLQNLQKNRTQKFFSEDEARRTMIPIVEAVKYMHSLNIMHRDLKLSNILLTKDFKIKIADFGLATYDDQKHRTMCGTPNFLSPEIAMSDYHSLESDIWSLGCILYTLLVGNPPFDTETTGKTLKRVRQCEFFIPAHVSNNARNLIQNLLQKNTNDRLKIQDVLSHSFFTDVSISQPNSKCFQRPLDSGMGSIGMSLSSTNSSRKSRSQFGGRDKENRPVLAQRNESLSYNRAYLDTGNMLDRGMPPRPRFGKSPPVRLNSNNTIGNVKLKSKCQDLPLLRYMGSSEKHFASSGIGDLEKENKRRKSQSPVRHSCDPEERSTHSERSRSNQSHGSCRNELNFCSQCTELHRCGREHCTRGFCTESQQRCTAPKRDLSPRHSIRNEDCGISSQTKPTCSHYGNCDRVYCQHNNMCHCRNLVEHPEHVQTCQHSIIQEPSSSGCHNKYSEDTVRVRDGTPPFTTVRLQPIRQKTKSAIVTLLSNGEVCLEFFKRTNNREKIVDVCRISHNGLKIMLYKPDRLSSVVGNDPPPVPTNSAVASFSYENLPEKHFKKYKYAARFVSLVQAKTPKLTYYDSTSKSILMENSVDFETSFYRGGKASKSTENTKIIDVCGRTHIICSNDELRLLNSDVTNMWKEFLRCEEHCKFLESILESSQQNTTKPVFPVIIGRRPAPTVSCSPGSNDNKENINSPPSLNSMAIRIPPMATYDGTIETDFCPEDSRDRLPLKQHFRQLKTKISGSRTTHSENGSMGQKLNVLKKIFLKGIGWATHFANGTVSVDFNDGTQVSTMTRSNGFYFTDNNGVKKSYSYKTESPLPVHITEKVNYLPIVISSLSGNGKSFSTNELSNMY